MSPTRQGTRTTEGGEVSREIANYRAARNSLRLPPAGETAGNCSPLTLQANGNELKSEKVHFEKMP